MIARRSDAIAGSRGMKPPERTPSFGSESSSLSTWTRRCSTSPPSSRPRIRVKTGTPWSTPPSLPASEGDGEALGQTRRPAAVYGFTRRMLRRRRHGSGRGNRTPANVNGWQSHPVGPAAGRARRGIPQTARIGERLSSRPSRPRAAARASLRPACGVETRRKRWRVLRLGTGRSTAFVAASKKSFGTWKRSYGLRRMRWRGLAKAGLQIRFTAVAYNIKRCSRILSCRSLTDARYGDR